jgi:hypothetical protein
MVVQEEGRRKRGRKVEGKRKRNSKLVGRRDDDDNDGFKCIKLSSS